MSLHTSPSAQPGQGDAGGMNVLVAESAKALAQSGHKVTVITRATTQIHAGQYPMHAEGAKHQPTLLAIHCGNPELSKVEITTVLAQCTREIEPLIEELGGFDVLHSHYWLSGIAVIPVAHSHSIPHITTLHTVAAQKNMHLAPGDTAEPQSRIKGEQRLTQEAFVVTSSHSELQAISRGYGDPARGAKVISPGVDTALFHPTQKSSTGAQIAVLGRVQPLKGQDLAVRSFAEFIRLRPDLASQSELVIAGEPTPGAEPFADELRSLARDLNLKVIEGRSSSGHSAARRPTVRFLPALSRFEAAELLGASHVVIVPSHTETFGLVALEAAAAGTPVVAEHTTGLAEAVYDGVSGVLLPNRDPKKWASSMSKLFTNSQERDRLNESARAWALTRSWDHHAQSLAELYSSLQKKA